MNLEELHQEEIFCCLKGGGRKFIQEFLGYDLLKQVFETNDVFKYKTYKLIYNSEDAKRLIKLYINDGKVLTINFSIETYKDKDGGYRYLDIYHYLGKEIGIKDNYERALLNTYKGETLSEKVSSFFIWLDSVMDERLENILKGKDWVDIPFDWGPYK